MGEGGSGPEADLQPLDEGDRAAVAEAASRVRLGQDFIEGCQALRVWLAQRQLVMSDRRWRQLVHLAQTAAATATPASPAVFQVQLRNDSTYARSFKVKPVVDAATGTVRVKAEVQDPPADQPLLGTPVLGHVALEALELAIPLYPRAPGAELGAVEAIPEGAAALEDEVIKPFAGLADLLKGQGKKE